MAASDATHGDGGKNKVAPASGTGDGQPVQPYGEDQNEDGSESEVGKRKAEQGDEAEGAVIQAIAVHGRADSGGNGEQNGQGKRGQGQHKGGGIGLRHQIA